MSSSIRTFATTVLEKADIGSESSEKKNIIELNKRTDIIWVLIISGPKKDFKFVQTFLQK